MGRKPDNLDLTDTQYNEILSLLEHYLPNTEVWVYGSRVKSAAKPYSDLDLIAFSSNDQRSAVINLKEAFEESSLPFRIDFFVWNEVPEQFHKNIMAERIVLQEKGDA